MTEKQKLADKATRVDAEAAAGGDGSALDLIAKDATAGPHVLQFRSPVYVARWIDDRHCVVGGGGGNRFGMTNGLALLAIAPTKSTAPSPPLWRYRGSVDLKGNILWCMSNLYTPPSPTDAVGAAAPPSFLCVSHLDSFSLLRVHGLRRPDAAPCLNQEVPPPTMVKICRVGLTTDDIENGEPEKKPVAIACGYVFAAQDDGTVASFSIAKLEERKETKPNDEEEDAAPSNDSIAGFASSNPQHCATAPHPLGGRANDIAAAPAPWDSSIAILVALCKDKKVKYVEFHTGRPATATQAAVSPRFGRSGAIDGNALGFAGKALLRSSLRLLMPMLQQQPVTSRLSSSNRRMGDKLAEEAYDATLEKTPVRSAEQVTFLIASLVEGVAYVQRLSVSASEATPRVDKPVKVGTEAPTAVTHCAVAAAAPAGASSAAALHRVLLATADGSVTELSVRTDRPIKCRRARPALHAEPISAIAAHANGGVVSADIAQRVIVSYCGVLGAPKAPETVLFPASAGSQALKLLAGKWTALALALLMVVIAGALAGQE